MLTGTLCGVLCLGCLEHLMAMADIRDTRANIQCSLAAVCNIAMTSEILRLRKSEERKKEAYESRLIQSTHYDT